jgi:hypothetical protein
VEAIKKRERKRKGREKKSAHTIELTVLTHCDADLALAVQVEVEEARRVIVEEGRAQDVLVGHVGRGLQLDGLQHTVLHARLGLRIELRIGFRQIARRKGNNKINLTNRKHKIIQSWREPTIFFSTLRNNETVDLNLFNFALASGRPMMFACE